MRASLRSLASLLDGADLFVDGDWVESKDQDPDGDVRLIQLADVGDGYYADKSNRFLMSATAKRLKCTYLHAGDVLVARMPDPIGRACIFPGHPKPAVTVVDVCILRVKETTTCARWLMHALNSPSSRRQILGFATGTTRSRISRGNLAKIQIPVPTLEEQRRIAAVLDKADALRTKRREALAQLDRLAKSIFLEMFGDPKFNPKAWPLKPIESVILDMRGGAAIQPADFVSQGFPVLHKGAIKPAGQIETDPKKKAFAELEYAMARPQNIVNRDYVAVTLRDLVPTGPSIGLAADLRHAPQENYLLAQGAYGVRLDPAQMQADYFVQLSNMPNFRYVLRQHAVGSTQIHIRNPVYRSIRMPTPPVELQSEFANRMRSLRRQTSRTEDSLIAFERLFDALQNRAFRGEL